MTLFKNQKAHYRLKTIFILISFLFFGKSYGQSSISKLGTFSLDSNTQWLGNAFNTRIGDSVRLVGLGEVTHGGHEIAEFKTKTVQYLINDKGFRLFLFEYPNSALSVLNYYLTAKNHSSMDTTRALSVEAFQNSILDESIPDLFVWIKKFNLEHPEDPVILKGIDITGANGSFYNYFMNNFSSLLDSATENQIRITKNMQPVDSACIIIIQWIDLHKGILQSKLQGHYSEFLYNLKCAEFSIKNSKNRDSVMAENIDYLLLQYNRKGIIWAHNMHITPASWTSADRNFVTKVLYPNANFEYSYFGRILHEKMNNRYYIILTDFSQTADIRISPIATGRKKIKQKKERSQIHLAETKIYMMAYCFQMIYLRSKRSFPSAALILAEIISLPVSILKYSMPW